MEQPAFPRERRTLSAILLIVLSALVFLYTLCQNDATSVPPDSSPALSASPAPVHEAVADVPPEAGLLVAFLDVGQGDCIFLRSPSGKTMLVDAGPDGSFGAISRFLDELGVAGLDVLIASHLHADHIGSMPEVVDVYPVGTFYCPPFDVDSRAYYQLLDALEENRVATSAPRASATSLIPWDDEVEVRILSPYDVVYKDYNDTSYILRVTYGQTSVLLTGDAGETAERLALKALPNRYFAADVLKVAHHGSRSGTSAKFLNAVNPSIAIISLGVDNGYGYPKEDVLERLIERDIRIYRTDLDGTILLLLDGTDARVLE